MGDSLDMVLLTGGMPVSQYVCKESLSSTDWSVWRMEGEGWVLSIGELSTGFTSNYRIEYNVWFGRVLGLYLDILACYFVNVESL